MSMEVVICAADTEGIPDLAQLRDWLGSAGSRAPWHLAPDPPPRGNALGIGIDEICAIISAASALPELVDRVGEWFTTRHDPGPIQLTITLDPAAPKHHDEPGRGDERLS
jgi:Effector Associated Constant Component 1